MSAQQGPQKTGCKIRGEFKPIDADDLAPGDCVSSDQLESPVPGMIPVWKGKPSRKGYKAATIFVDHASRFLNISMALSTGGEEAVASKQKFEKQCKDSGVEVKGIEQTMASMQASASRKHVMRRDRVCLSVASMLIGRMELQSAPFEPW